MSLEPALLNLLTRRLTTLDNDSAAGPGLLADAQRLWNRLRRFIPMGLIGVTGQPLDEQALELACYALQLPNRHGRNLPPPRSARPSLRQRCEQAAELLVSLFDDEQADEALLERTAHLLQETPQRSPAMAEARLLADGVNLDDFGVVGLIGQAMQLALAGQGVEELAAAIQRREEYGYWDMRLKESFHFEPIGQIARQRLQEARKVAAMLNAELTEDKAGE